MSRQRSKFQSQSYLDPPGEQNIIGFQIIPGPAVVRGIPDYPVGIGHPPFAQLLENSVFHGQDGARGGYDYGLGDRCLDSNIRKEFSAAFRTKARRLRVIGLTFGTGNCQGLPIFSRLNQEWQGASQESITLRPLDRTQRLKAIFFLHICRRRSSALRSL